MVNYYDVCSSIDNELLIDKVNYIYNTYDVDCIKKIIFIGDCASWIRNFPKSYWFNFRTKTKVLFAMDGYHFSKASNHLTTQEVPQVKIALKICS